MRRFVLPVVLFATAAATAQSVTFLSFNGSTGAKRNLYIVGDGFTANEQGVFDQYVNTTILQGVFRNGDALAESMNAFNIIRINVASTQSGVTRVDQSGNVVTARNTYLDYRYSGIWSRCWMEPGPRTSSALDALRRTYAPWADYWVIVLNETGGGGCARGNQIAVTRGVGWDTIAHELGHMVGGLGDEYFGGTARYTGGEPSAPNLSRNGSRSVKWSQYIAPTTPVPTLASQVADQNRDVGVFEGGTLGTTQYRYGLFRPVENCRMRSNTPAFCPVCYEALRDALYGYDERFLWDTVIGDFNGDGRDDVVLHGGTTLTLYTSDGSRLNQVWTETMGWHVHAYSRILVTDFDGDRRSDLIVTSQQNAEVRVFRSTGTGFVLAATFTGSFREWTLQIYDQFLVGDWNGDGRRDLAIFNPSQWGSPIIAFFTSTGSSFALSHYYYASIPGWGAMKPNDKFLVADCDGDNRDDLYVSNSRDWAVVYLQALRSTGNGLQAGPLYGDSVPGWTMRRGDQLFVADFDADRRDDLYVFNPTDWSQPYFGMLRSSGVALTRTQIYANSIPGWGAMKPNDRFFVADVNGDVRDDLYVYNAFDFGATRYLGTVRSDGLGLNASYQANAIGHWTMSILDLPQVANFNGGNRMSDLIVRNGMMLTMLASNGLAVSNVRHYPKYIRNLRYHALGWW